MAKKTWSGFLGKIGEASRDGGKAFVGAATGTVEAGAGVGHIANQAALNVAHGGADVLKGTAWLANTKLGKATIVVSATVAAALGVKKWYDNRVERKHAEAAMAQSTEGQSLQEQLAATKLIRAKLMAEMGESTQVSGNAAANVMNGRGNGQVVNTSQPIPS